MLGTRGLGGFAGLVIGSTAVSLAGRAQCPMVVVRGAGDEPPPTNGPVVVGVDDHDNSEAALELAFAEAALHGAELVAVHTWSEPVADTVLLGHRTRRTSSRPNNAPTRCLPNASPAGRRSTRTCG